MTNDFFSGDFNLKDILFENSTDFFATDVKTILGKNMVKNFVCRINLELKTLGYSDSANDIAQFYDECKKSGGIIKFITNPVIKMILLVVQEYSEVKRYLNDRIFDDVEQDRIQDLEHTFANNEEISEKNQEEEHVYKFEKEIKRKKILKIQKQKKCTFEQAEKIYNEIENKKFQKNITKELDSFLKTCASQNFIILDDKDVFKEKENKNEVLESNKENQEIDLDEPPSTDIPFTNNDDFWGTC